MKELAKALGVEVQVLVDKVVPECKYGSNEHLEGIVVKGNYAIGTDARMIMQVPLAKVFEEDVPTNVLRGERIEKSVWISRAGLQKAFKNLCSKAVLPVLTNIFLRQTKNETLMLTTDLEHIIEIKESRKMEDEKLVQFPDPSGLSKLRKPVYATTVSPDLLKKLVEIAIKLSQNKISLIFQADEETNGIAFYFETPNGLVKGIIMPLQSCGTLKDHVAKFDSVPFLKK